MKMQVNRAMQSHFLTTAKARRGEKASLQLIVVFVAIICTGLKSVFWADSAAEIRIVQWKVTSVRRKGPNVHWKGSRSAAESWSSQIY